MIHLVVMGEPIPQPRHRTVLRPKKGGGQVPVQLAAQNDHGIWPWRDKIGHELVKALQASTLAVGVSGFPNPVIAYELVFPRPKGVKLLGVEKVPFVGKPRKWRAPEYTCPGGKGDLDNHQKCVMDVGNDLGIWPDDRYVWLVAGCMKRVASGEEPDLPRADITVWDASEFSLELWLQWCMDHWPREWGAGAPIVRKP